MKPKDAAPLMRQRAPSANRGRRRSRGKATIKKQGNLPPTTMHSPEELSRRVKRFASRKGSLGIPLCSQNYQEKRRPHTHLPRRFLRDNFKGASERSEGNVGCITAHFLIVKRFANAKTKYQPQNGPLPIIRAASFPKLLLLSQHKKNIIMRKSRHHTHMSQTSLEVTDIHTQKDSYSLTQVSSVRILLVDVPEEQIQQWLKSHVGNCMQYTLQRRPEKEFRKQNMFLAKATFAAKQKRSEA
ncbi:uncharacterized protein Tco025E_00433 [Trypanosoma conorhini]|uniref:Uncharacterized protein n=1 Tax=Trypanosoma conorhini TaxID=83891 RepID=A0A3R7PZ22_9TRYP|nr:uncharacterized protein Tco025E_00433 [Trypanosoma conorhini]RNF27363.1 hypothetical protein Tco025E_00433 [Trypanosoma conorhini]